MLSFSNARSASPSRWTQRLRSTCCSAVHNSRQTYNPEGIVLTNAALTSPVHLSPTPYCATSSYTPGVSVRRHVIVVSTKRVSWRHSENRVVTIIACTSPRYVSKLYRSWQGGGTVSPSESARCQRPVRTRLRGDTTRADLWRRARGPRAWCRVSCVVQECENAKSQWSFVSN